jgi:subtilisin family serine protease
VPIVVQVAAGDGAGSFMSDLAAAGFSTAWTQAGRGLLHVGLRVEPDRMGELLRLLDRTRGLVAADLQPPIRLRNAASAWRCQSGQPWVTPVFAHGLLGQGQIVGIMDTGIDADSCYFWDGDHGLPVLDDDISTTVDLRQRKVLAVDFYWSHDWPDPSPFDWDDHGHGIHVAGSVAGDAGANGTHEGNDGMAPAARLVIQDGGFGVDDCADLPGLGCPTRPLGPVLAQAYTQGARLHTDSWGDEENIQPFNRYTERTADVDRFTWEHRDFLVFFAAGNAGQLGDDTVGSPATGKNVVAVGAATHGDIEPPCVTVFSSRGWTQDGRIKPDVVAPGAAVVSAADDGFIGTFNCGLLSLSGTSMASPTVAGLAALVRQYFVDGYYPNGAADSGHGLTPSAALVKTMLIASAVDLSTEGCDRVRPVPSRDQGWGEVRLDRVLHFAGDNLQLLVDDHRDGFSSAAEPAVATVVRNSGEAPLKVVLVWTDPPSTSLAAVNLVNDLDLRVSGPDGDYLGNVFSGGVSVTGGGADRLNNVEVVWLPAPSAGRWTVTVSPYAVNLGPQDYALVVTGATRPATARRARRRLVPEPAVGEERQGESP